MSQLCALKTIFSYGAIIQVLLSVLSLIFELTFSKFSRHKMLFNNSIIKFTETLNYTYKSKRVDVKKAIQQMNQFNNYLLCDEHLKISHVKVAKRPTDNQFEILLVFKLCNHRKLHEVIEQLNVFTAYLDDISLI
jgi:hypothetical protein